MSLFISFWGQKQENRDMDEKKGYGTQLFILIAALVVFAGLTRL